MHTFTTYRTVTELRVFDGPTVMSLSDNHLYRVTDVTREIWRTSTDSTPVTDVTVQGVKLRRDGTPCAGQGPRMVFGPEVDSAAREILARFGFEASAVQS